MSRILKNTNISAGVLAITDREVLRYVESYRWLPGVTFDLPESFRESSQQLNSWRNGNLIEMRLVEGVDPEELGIRRTETRDAESVAVLPNDNPLIDEPNVQRFLDEVEDRLAAGTGGGTRFIVEEITLTATNIANKYVTLQNVPVNSNVSIAIANGPQQSKGPDYGIAGQNITWSGLALDGVVSAGDELVIEYEVSP